MSQIIRFNHVVANFQNLYKSLGLAISGRINLWISSSDVVVGALRTHTDYMSEETVAGNVDLGAVLSDDAQVVAASDSLDLDDGSKVTVNLEKA